MPIKLKVPTPFLAIDTETTGLNPHFDARPFIVTCCDHLGTYCYFECSQINPHTREVSWSRNTLSQIKTLIRKYPYLIFHNCKFDLRMLSTIGLDLSFRFPNIHDTLTLSHVLDNSESHALKDLGIKYLDMLDSDEKQLRSHIIQLRAIAKRQNLNISSAVSADYWLAYHYRNSHPDAYSILQTYAIQDTIRTARLMHAFYPHLLSEKLAHAYERERRILAIAYEMESHGVTIKPKSLARKARQFERIRQSHITTATQQAKLSGFTLTNINSTKQLRTLLFSPEHFGYEPITYSDKTGDPSTATHVLEELHSQSPSPILTALLEYRRYDTAIKYLENYMQHTTPATKVHTTFNTNGTAFTRFSSSDPNLQNVGARDSELSLREVFGPPPGYEWWCLDYSQLELRIGAALSRDPTLMEAFTKDLDIHQITADALGCSRKQAKNINFAWWYGASIPKLSAMANLDATDFNAQMSITYPGVLNFMQSTINHVQRHKHVHTAYGYRINLDPWKAYVGVNARVQGTAGDIMKNAMILVADYLSRNEDPSRCTLILNIHDELVFQLRKDPPIKLRRAYSANVRYRRTYIANIKYRMEFAGQLLGIHTPVDAELCKSNWGHNTTPSLPPPSDTSIPSDLITLLSNPNSPSTKPERKPHVRSKQKT